MGDGCLGRAARIDVAARGLGRWARPVLAFGLALAVADCSSDISRHSGLDPKYGVRASPKVIPDGEPIPKGGGHAMVGQPYVVGGRTYVPRKGDGYVKEGFASWYGAAFHGRLTANGEVFDRESVAAASPVLPLPSYVRVTNVVNHRSMVVRVNDRGPYEAGRLMDVSERVAVALDFRRKGTQRVRVEYLGKASLAGSDDRRLLATLRTEDLPANATHRFATMLADLGPPPKDESAPTHRLATRAAAEGAPTPAAGRAPADGRATKEAPIRVASLESAPAELLPEPQHPSAALPPRRSESAPSFRPEAGKLRQPLTLAPSALPPARPVLAGIY